VATRARVDQVGCHKVGLAVAVHITNPDPEAIDPVVGPGGEATVTPVEKHGTVISRQVGGAVSVHVTDCD
jgi:hypothetical protein